MFEFDDKLDQKDKDAFHFVAYIPIKGRLYELDGLKKGPIDLGKCDPDDWLETVRPILSKRMHRLVLPYGVFCMHSALRLHVSSNCRAGSEATNRAAGASMYVCIYVRYA